MCVLCPSKHKRSSRSQSRTIVLVSISNGTCKYILGQRFWFGLLVLLNLGVYHFIDSFVCYYCLFVKTQGEHQSTQCLLGQRPWGSCAYIENSLGTLYSMWSGDLVQVCGLHKQSPHRCCLPGRSARASTWQKAAVTTLFLSDQTGSPLA